MSQKSSVFCVLSFFAFLSTPVESESTRVIESESETCVPKLQVKGLTQPPAPAGTKIQLSYVYISQIRNNPINTSTSTISTSIDVINIKSSSPPLSSQQSSSAAEVPLTFI